MDDTNVQPSEVSADVTTEGTTLPEVETPQPLSLTEEQINTKISEAVSKELEIAKREIQSAKDKSTAEVTSALKRAKLAETTLQSMRGSLKEADPEVAQTLELAELRARDQHYKESEGQDYARQQQTVFDQSFHTQMNQFIVGMGIDPNDPKIDWGTDATNYLDKQQRILSSLGGIQKANSKTAEEKRSQEVKELEAKLRKELGLDSVDTSSPVGTGSDQAWLERWGNGDIEATPQNLKKAMTLQRKLYGG